MSFDLTTTAAPSPASPLANTTTAFWALSAVYPDGTLILTSGEPNSTAMNPIFPTAAGNNAGMVGPATSAIVDTATGASTGPTGLAAPYAVMPMFSPDGTQLVFNGVANPDAGAGAAGHSLTLVDFDVATKTFSNAKTIFQDPSRYPGWPSFTPDSREIVFTLGNGSNFASEIPPVASTLYGAELYVVDVATGISHRLDAAS